MLDPKRMRFPIDIILVCIRWYAAYPFRYRHLEEMIEEREVPVDNSTISRWAIRFLPALEKVFVSTSVLLGQAGGWRYIKLGGQWKYLYRTVDKQGCTIDFLMTAKRDTAAATQFFKKAMLANGEPEKVTMNKSSSNKAAIDEINRDREVPIEVCQIKYLNNIVEQDHRAVKRITKTILGFNHFEPPVR